jgi:hypothetical protein
MMSWLKYVAENGSELFLNTVLDLYPKEPIKTVKSQPQMWDLTSVNHSVTT